MIALALTFTLASAQNAIDAIEVIDRAHRQVRSLGETKKDACWDCPLGEPEICSGPDVCRAFSNRGSRAELVPGLPNYQREACAPTGDEARIHAYENFQRLLQKHHAEKVFAAASREALESGDARSAGKRLPEELRAAWLDLLAKAPSAEEARGDDVQLKKIFADARRKTAQTLGRRDAAFATAVKKIELTTAPAAACADPNAYLDEGVLYVCPQLRTLPEPTLTSILARELGRAIGPCPAALASVTTCLRGGGPGETCDEDAQAAWVATEVLAEDLEETTMDARRRAFASIGFFAAHACKLETGTSCQPEISGGATFKQTTDLLFANPVVRAKLGCPKTAVKHCD